MNRFLKNFASIITVLAGIAAIIGLVLQYSENKPRIEIKTITEDKLTELPSIDGLRAEYRYKDSVVTSLWKLNYIVSNSGKQSLIGQGNKKNIINNTLSFWLPKEFKILEVKNNKGGLPIDLKYSNDKIEISFLQWKESEAIELVIYAEQQKENAIPSLLSNEREIVDGLIVYSTIERPATPEDKAISDYLPPGLRSVLKWVGIIGYGLTLIIIPIVWIDELVKVLKFKKWKKDDLWMYNDWIEEQIKEGNLDGYRSPKELPNNLWNTYPYPPPSLPNDDFKNMSLGFAIFIVMALIPLLWIIEI